jgi:hypothetical protein
VKDGRLIHDVVIRIDDRRETTVKGNNSGGWSSDGVVLWLGRRQNEDAVEWFGEGSV